MREVRHAADALVRAMVESGGGTAHLLDSCGVGRPGANRLIGGIVPVRVFEISELDPWKSIKQLEALLSDDRFAAIFTLSYDLGARLAGVDLPRQKGEPDIYVALFESLFVHDYETGRSFEVGNTGRPESLTALYEHPPAAEESVKSRSPAAISSNFSESEYMHAVSRIKDLIRDGETYQTNLTQQFEARLPKGRRPADVFLDLRVDHPAAFAAFIERTGTTVVSASPEQFFRVETCKDHRRIVADPIKGTRPRGLSPADDEQLRNELASSDKDRAENIMIVDLMRNDLGRICEYGSIKVEDLCRIEQHPTLFHLVSTVSGILRPNTGIAEILSAVFPCGSITGAPKIRTMEIIAKLEPGPRGLSMGAIGCRIPETFGIGEVLQASVAIRTMVIREGTARFNVGGGVVIDSDPMAEYEESLLKAKALLHALGSVKDDRVHPLSSHSALR